MKEANPVALALEVKWGRFAGLVNSGIILSIDSRRRQHGNMALARLSVSLLGLHSLRDLARGAITVVG